MTEIDETGLRDEEPIFAEDVSLFLLGDTGVVFSETAQDIYQLNTTATYIWCQFEEGLSPSQVADELAQTFGLPRENANAHVREALAGWKDLGFLAGRRKDPTDPREIALSPLPGEAFAGALEQTSSTRCYRIFEQLYRVSYGTPEIEAWIHPALSHLESPGEEPKSEAVQVLAVEESGRFVIAREGYTAYRCVRFEEMAPLLKWAVFSHVLECSDQAIAIHAGAVCRNERALILAGGAGSGKSTLTAALVQAGFGYLSDDLILVERDSATIQGIPFSLSVKESGVDLLSSRFPVLKELRTHKRVDQKRVRYLPLEATSLDRRPEIAWIVFPTYAPQGDNELRPMAPAIALQELAKSCSLVRPISRSEVGGLVSLLGRVACYGFRVSSLDRATKTLAGLFAAAEM